ncbi:hypothetical protein PV682_32400 [Streptomyces niveiscabiei]|nr:hypothetical protein [Streptomyces niveiscabiei]MDX3386123.1 hypothetical protein [Streptomyces niveiscabiei]
MVELGDREVEVVQGSRAEGRRLWPGGQVTAPANQPESAVGLVRAQVQ